MSALTPAIISAFVTKFEQCDDDGMPDDPLSELISDGERLVGLLASKPEHHSLALTLRQILKSLSDGWYDPHSWQELRDELQMLELGLAAEASKDTTTDSGQDGASKSREEWENLALVILMRRTESVKSITDVFDLLKAEGYPHGRQTLYKMPKLKNAAAGLGIYTPDEEKKTGRVRRGYRTSDGIEAEDDSDVG